jgi:hypothetical protein
MSKIEQEKNNNDIYLKIIDGSLRQKSQEGMPEAVRREWMAGGKSGTAYEIVHPAAFGRIVDVSFYEGEHEGKKFKTLNVTLDENEDGKNPVISVGVGTKYAQDILKKLPSVNFDEEVRIRPFSFIPDGEEKAVTGVEITQRDRDEKFTKKCDNFFIKKEKVGNEEKWLPANGFPARNKPFSEQNDEEKEIYRIQVRSFLVNYTTENIVPRFSKVERPKFETAEAPRAANIDRPEPIEVNPNSPWNKERPSGKVMGTDMDYPDEINPEDIPLLIPRLFLQPK